MVLLTNYEREKIGLKALQTDLQLSQAARFKSNDMYLGNYFSTTSPFYGPQVNMLKLFGISYKEANENIAKGQKTADQLVLAWMKSPKQRANILNPNYTHIGVGYVANGNISTQMFIKK